MKNAIRRTARWLFVSAPGVGVLVISAGLGIGYAATNDGDKVEPAGEPGTFEMHVGGPGEENLSEADREAVENFHQCIRDQIGEPPTDGNPPDPSQMREKFQAAFDKCKGELPENLRQEFEQRQQQMEEFQSCMEEQGVSPPSPGGDRPSKQDLEKLREAHEACADKLPEGGGCGIAFGGPGPGGPGGPPIPFGPPPGSERGQSEGGQTEGGAS